MPTRLKIIGFCEAHLTKESEPLYKIPNFKLLTNNNTGSKGGVALYVRNDIECEPIPEITFMTNYIECLFLKCNINKLNYIIGIIYRRPGSDQNAFLEKLKYILNKIQTFKTRCILGGDINIDLIKHEHQPYVKEFVNTMFSYGYHPLIHKPTRVTSSSATLLDHIWVSNPEGTVGGCAPKRCI